MYSLSVKPVGGDTLFMSGSFIYDQLGPKQRAEAEDTLVHYIRTPQPMHASGYRARIASDPPDENAGSHGAVYKEGNQAGVVRGQSHPLVWMHPSNGRKAIMAAPMWVEKLAVPGRGGVGDPARGLDDARLRNLTHEESHERIEGMLSAGMFSEYRHVWQEGDFVVWDNRWLYHTATPNSGLSKAGLRLLHRIRLNGEYRPAAPQSGRLTGQEVDSHGKDVN